MQIEKYKVDELNQQLIKKHKSSFEHIAEDVAGLDNVMKKLMAFNIAIPSWALGTGGTYRH
jgi:L-rhamnose isomerase/sugar isomerase